MESKEDKKLTPMLAQYRNIKARYPDAIVLFRLGDFYETFDADARIAARELELALTGRSFAKGVRMAMAGVPHNHVDSYIGKLIERGYKVAVVEQLEDPKKVKKLVKRDVVRVITPGTVVEDALLHAKEDNFLAAVVRGESARARDPMSVETFIYGLALLDISTGEFATTQIEGVGAEAKLLEELQRVQPSEYVLADSLLADEALAARLRALGPARLSPIPERAARPDEARRALHEHFRVATLEPYGCERLPLAVAAAGAALYYLQANQPASQTSPRPSAVQQEREQTSPRPSPVQQEREQTSPRPSPVQQEREQTSPRPSPVQQEREGTTLAHLNHLWTFSLDDYMTLDAATRRNLELTAPIHAYADASDARATRSPTSRSLFGVLDRTVTAMGARLLKRWVQQPLLDLAQINERLDAVAELHGSAFLRDDLRRLLDGLYDVERLVGRIGFGNANARDLMALKRALLRLPAIKAKLVAATSAGLQTLGANLDELQDVANLIDTALVDSPPVFIKEGGLIRHGYDPALDELRKRATAEKAWLSDLEERERKRTGIKNLRVRYNEVFGFFIEAPRSAAKQIPKDYERRATISHAERYVTPELKAKEASILSTEDRVNDLEYELFANVRRTTAAHSARLQAAARILSQVDALGALADAAVHYNYVRPVVDDGDTLEVREGRHPVVERFLRDDERFVPNDAHLDGESQRVIILTGPNMSGKSVFVRQVALITLMAQIGSFVPAATARIGLTDRIFTRIGASDDIAQGRSTFLVEMGETSYILRHATRRSLIVLDEVGRGTSTYDGISLAWAIAEEIHDALGAKTLFATHYHELTELASMPRADGALPANAFRNFTMAVHERGSEVVFLRQVIEGGAEKSFGIHVAQLAGLNARIIGRANEVLARLEAERTTAESGLQTTDDGRQTTETDVAAIARERPSIYETGEAHADPSGITDHELRSSDSSAVVRRPSSVVAPWRAVLAELAQVDIANLTPIQALNWLNAMQMRVRELSLEDRP